MKLHFGKDENECFVNKMLTVAVIIFILLYGYYRVTLHIIFHLNILI